MKRITAIALAPILLCLLHSPPALAETLTGFGFSFSASAPTGASDEPLPGQEKDTPADLALKTKVKHFESWQSSASCTLSVINVAPEKQHSRNMMSYIEDCTDIRFGEPEAIEHYDNATYQRLIERKKDTTQQPHIVIDRTDSHCYASETGIKMFGKDFGFVYEQGYVSLGGAIVEIYCQAPFIGSSVTASLHDIKTLCINTLKMLFADNPAGSNDDNVLRKDVLYNLTNDLGTIYNDASLQRRKKAHGERAGKSRPDSSAPAPADIGAGRIAYGMLLILLVTSPFFFMACWPKGCDFRTLFRRVGRKSNTVYENVKSEFNDLFGDAPNNEEFQFDDAGEAAAPEDNELDRCLAILELPPQATFADVKRQYRIMAQIFHPDKLACSGEAKAWATAKFLKINNAYDILKKHFAS